MVIDSQVMNFVRGERNEEKAYVLRLKKRTMVHPQDGVVLQGA